MHKTLWATAITATLGSAIALLPAAAPAEARSVTQRPAHSADNVRSARTIVRNRAALQRLRSNSGMTLQWISWDRRGRARATTRTNGMVWLEGEQRGANGASLRLSGAVREIGSNYFTFDGTITMLNTPDPGRRCIRNGPMTFRVTQNRRYWRLQQMEVCDGLTDYVDIYF